MADETTRAIDRVFDLLDNGVDAASRVLNRHQHTEQRLQQQKPRGKRREIIDAEAASKPKAKPSASTTVAKRPHFYIVEAVDPKSGSTIFVVTDGGNARTECGTREFAAQILRALEKTP